MPPLTWRDVEAPDLRSSLLGINAASTAFKDAFTTAGSALTEFDTGITKEANNEVALNLLKYQDPTKYKAALESGEAFAGADPRRLSNDTLNFASNRVGELLRNANTEFTLGKDQYLFGQDKDKFARLDAAEPAFAELFAAAQGPDPDKATAAVRTKYQEVLGNAPTTELLAAYTGGQGLVSGKLGIDKSRLDLATGNFDFGVKKRDDAVNQAAIRLADSVRLGSNDAEGARAILDEFKGDPAVRNAALGLLGSFGTVYGDTSGGGGGVAGTGGGGGAGGGGGGTPIPGVIPAGGGKQADYSQVKWEDVRERILSKEGPKQLGGWDALAFNTAPGRNRYGVKPPKPISQMTLGELYDFQVKSMRPLTKGARGKDDVGSTGAGAFQFEAGTMAENAQVAFGKDWRNQKFDAKTQDTLGRTLFDRVKGNPAKLAKTWAIFGDPSADVSTALELSRARKAQQDPTGFYSKLQTARDNKQPPTVAELVDKFSEGRLGKELGRSGIENLINRVITETRSQQTGAGGVSTAEAEVIINDSLDERAGGLLDVMFGDPKTDYGTTINEKKLKEHISAARQGGGTGALANISAQDSQNALLTSAYQAYQAADAKVRANAEAARSQKGLTTQQRRLINARDDARDRVNELLTHAAQHPDTYLPYVDRVGPGGNVPDPTRTVSPNLDPWNNPRAQDPFNLISLRDPRKDRNRR